MAERILKRHVDIAERDYANKLTQYGDKNQATLNAEVRYRDLKDKYAKQQANGKQN